MEHQPHFLSEPLPQLLLSEVLPNSSEDGVPAFPLLSGSSLALRGTLPLCCSISGAVTVAVVGQGPPEDKVACFLNSRKVYPIKQVLNIGPQGTVPSNKTKQNNNNNKAKKPKPSWT